MRHSLESGKLLGCTACCADVVPIVQIKIWIIKLFASFEFHGLSFLGIREVELNDQWILIDDVPIAFIDVPHGFLLVAVEDVPTVAIEDLTVVVLDIIDLVLSAFLFQRFSLSFNTLCAFVLGFLIAIHELLLISWVHSD